MARWKLKAETSGAEGPGSCGSDEAALNWDGVGLSHCSLWSWQACANSFACSGSLGSMVPEGAPWLVPWGSLSFLSTLGIFLWSLRLVTFLLRWRPLAVLPLCPFYSRFIPSVPVTLQHHPDDYSLLWQCPQAQFRGSCQPELLNCALSDVPTSFFIGHWLLPTSWVPLWRYPLRIAGLHSLPSSSFTHKPLVSSEQWLSFSINSWGPKYFPIVCDFIKTYLPATPNQLIYTNMITGENDLLLFCPPKDQIASLQDLSLDNALASPKGLQWWPFHFHRRWAFQCPLSDIG